METTEQIRPEPSFRLEIGRTDQRVTVTALTRGHTGTPTVRVDQDRDSLWIQPISLPQINDLIDALTTARNRAVIDLSTKARTERESA
jgi:hypothetical protein